MLLYVDSAFINDIPTEHWCNQMNDPTNQTLFPDTDYGRNRIDAMHYYCFHNETGWHINNSVEVVLV